MLPETTKVRRKNAIPRLPQGLDLRSPHTTVGDPRVQQEHGAETVAESRLFLHCVTSRDSTTTATASSCLEAPQP